MLYATAAIELAREYMESGSGSYRQLASYLNRIYPRIDGPWTKDATYHMCRLNGISSKRRKKDPTFPKPIKFSDSRQAAAYYVIAELNSWLAAKIKARDAE